MRIKGSTRIFKGPCANNTPRQTPNPPKCRPIQSKPAVFGVFSPNGSAVWPRHHRKLRAHRHQMGGNCNIRAATRRRYPASQLLMLQNPHRRRCGGTEAPQSMAAGTGPVAEPGPVAVAGRQARQNSPSAAAPPVFSRQNSPSNLKNVKFGVFRARRANFFTLTPTIGP